jgi:hypothetical protein
VGLAPGLEKITVKLKAHIGTVCFSTEKPKGSFLNEFLRLQKSWRIGNVGFGSVQAYTLHRRKLAPTRVLKNWPQQPSMFFTHNQNKRLLIKASVTQKLFRPGQAWARPLQKVVYGRVARFFLVHDTRTEKMYQMVINFSKCPNTYINIFQSKTTQNLPQSGFWI